ncbi:MAG TPA: arginine--tRNA ligase, partial [Firmicutes bacterium]|nr:arginine--tRNA ligase [Bacillota bacterium]
MDFYKKELAVFLAPFTGMKPEEIEGLIEIPPNPEMGDFAFPCYRLAGLYRKSPAVIAAELKDKLAENELFPEVKNEGPYLNFVIDRPRLAKDILTKIKTEKEKYGSADIGRGGKVVIDYSSPNIAKPFGVGHLRSTVIGHSLYRIYNFLNYQSVGINHLGDWGTQFGKIISAFKRWGKEEALQEDPIKHLFDLYVRFHQEAEHNPDLDEEGRYWFKKLEDGDPVALNLWQEFRELSLREFKRIYSLLGIEFDCYQGESFYNDMLEATIREIIDRGITQESQGALIVDLGEELPPCLLRKKDGATLYVTRDLSAALYRYEKYRFIKALYVVGEDQKLYFRQFFRVLELMGKEWASRCFHVPFGLIRFKDGKMSTRKGKVVLLEEVLHRAITLALEIIKEKNPSLKNKEAVARQVGIGA